jgi:hypothetical protein
MRFTDVRLVDAADHLPPEEILRGNFGDRYLLRATAGEASTNGRGETTRRMIIGVLTAAKHEARRAAVRNTWGRDAAAHLECDLVFLIGDPTLDRARREGDVLYLPCPDDYDSLPQKTRKFCIWALEQPDWQYLFKCDDDTYVHVERLLAVREWPTAIVGGKHTDDGHFHGGAGYTINRPAAQAIAEHLTAAKGLEDWKARDAIHRAGLRFSLDHRLCWDKSRMPTRLNGSITCHYASPVRMRLIHDGFRPAGEGTIPRIIHHIWCGSAADIPPRLQAYRETWMRHHPEWEFRLHTGEHLRGLVNQRLLDAAPTATQKSQIARYEILRQCGGVYVDFDVECLRPIDSLLVGEVGVAAAEDDDAVGVAVLACRPGDRLMQRCIEALPASCHFRGDVPRESGAWFFAPHLLAEPAWRLHWWQAFYPRHWSGRVVAPPSGAYAEHYWDASWQGRAIRAEVPPPRPQPERVSDYQASDLTFLMHVYHDAPAAADAVHSIQRVYPSARVILICDGGDASAASRLGAERGVSVILGERLFCVDRGGEIIRRMLGAYLMEPTKWLLKVDPDTAVRRRLSWLPATGLAGSLNCEQRRSLQGGCIVISHDAATRIFDARADWLPQLYDWRSWAMSVNGQTDGLLAARARRERLTSIDWTLAYCCRMLDVPVWSHDEIASEWKYGVPLPPADYAIVHPHLAEQDALPA